MDKHRRICTLTWICLNVAFVTVQALSGDDECDIHLLANETAKNYIWSPNYPLNFPDAIHCNYTIHVPGAKLHDVICFTFWRFDLQNDLSCNKEYLQFPGRLRYCGGGHVDQTQEGVPLQLRHAFSRKFCWPLMNNAFEVEFVINGPETMKKRGFYAHYQVVNENPIDVALPCIELSKNPDLKTEPAEEVPEHQGNCTETCPNGVLCDQNGLPTCKCYLPEEAPCTSDEWTCSDRKCIPLSAMCDFKTDCSDGSDEDYENARCPNRDKFRLETCDFELDACGFLGLQGWSRTTAQDASHRWQIWPTEDHTTRTPQGYYLTVIPLHSWALTAPPKAIFMTQAITTRERYCFSFWYYLYGYEHAELDVVFQDHIIWSLDGNHGDEWHNGKVEIPAGMHGMIAVHHTPDPSGYSVLALDDIYLMDGPCNPPDPSCTFRLNMCNWEAEETGENTGVWEASDYGAVYTADNTSLPISTSLISPTVQGELSDTYCLRFRLMSLANLGVSVTFSTFELVADEQGRPGQRYDSPVLWTHTTEATDVTKSTVWHRKAAVQFVQDVPYRIRFDLKMPAYEQNIFILYEVHLLQGICTYPEPTPFPSQSTEIQCPNGTLPCTKSPRECFDEALLCDGYPDCTNAEDEDPDTCPGHGGGVVIPTQPPSATKHPPPAPDTPKPSSSTTEHGMSTTREMTTGLPDPEEAPRSDTLNRLTTALGVSAIVVAALVLGSFLVLGIYIIRYKLNPRKEISDEGMNLCDQSSDLSNDATKVVQGHPGSARNLNVMDAPMQDVDEDGTGDSDKNSLLPPRYSFVMRQRRYEPNRMTIWSTYASKYGPSRCRNLTDAASSIPTGT